MKRIGVLLIGFLGVAALLNAADLSTASSQDLIALYKQLRAIPGGGQVTSVENAVFKRDSAAFTFINGRLVFAAPVAGRVLAAHFRGEGKFELNPPSPVDQRQIARFAKSAKLEDTFNEAIFYFTDDTFAEMSKLMHVKAAPEAVQAAFAPAQKRYAEDFNNWVDNQRKGYPTMRNMAARMLADLTDPYSNGFFFADFKGKKSGNLLFHISWNRDSLLLSEYAKGEEVSLLHINPGNYHEWWSGFHLSSEYGQSPHPDHRNLLVHCPSANINLLVARDNTLSATAQMEFVIAGGTARILPFNLNGVLRISSIEDGAGNKLSFIQEDRKLDNDPWLILAEPAKPGEKYKIKITYREDSTRDSRVVFQRGNGLYYVTARESWFPSFGAFDDRTRFEMHARSPKDFKFVASGLQVSSSKEKADLVTSWKSDLPLSVMGFNYGDFVESTQGTQDLKVTAYSGKDIPDELKAVDAAISVAQLGQMTSGRGRMIDVAASQGIMRGGFSTSANVKYAASLSLQAFKLFEFLFGPLPFKAVSVTEQPVRGYGQSWPYLIFLPYDSLLDSTTRNSLGLMQSRGSREFYSVVAVHEMAHQWWGHLVGWKTYHDQWLSEGVADFSSSLYLRQFEPKELSSFRDLRRNWMLSKNAAGDRPVDVGPVWLNAQLDEYNAWDNSRLIYYKGGYIMEMLRILMHDRKLNDPDSRFVAMLRDFTMTYAGQNASTEDFRRTVEKHIGGSMEWFFNQWVYGAYTPSYKFSYQLAEADAGQTEILLSVTQSGVPESFHMQLPIYIVIKGEYQYLGLLGVTGTKPLKTGVKLPMRPEKVVLDPERSILAEIDQ